MSKRKIVKIDNKSWSDYFDDATKRMFGCEPELLLHFTPFIQLYVFDYGRLNQFKHFFAGCELTQAKVEEKGGDIVDNVSHVYMKFGLSESTLKEEGDNLYYLEDDSVSDEVHVFYNETDSKSIFLSEELILGMRVKEEYKEDMECRL